MLVKMAIFCLSWWKIGILIFICLTDMVLLVKLRDCHGLTQQPATKHQTAACWPQPPSRLRYRQFKKTTKKGIIIIIIIIINTNMQNKLYTIQFFSPPDDWSRSQSLSIYHWTCRVRRAWGFCRAHRTPGKRLNLQKSSCPPASPHL